mmetsp:Transcript_8736/g.31493  ORF Transcript_8736/g.31493 Transcript_8736/m.31493 type:complete len:431 (+) Transcript_8736:72-1364(+)
MNRASAPGRFMAAAPCRGAVPSTSSPRFHHARHPRPLSCKGTRLVRDSKVAVVPLPNRPRGFGGRCGSDSRCTIQTCRAALGDTGYQKSLGYSPISIAVTAVALVVSGVANRVAHKVASVAFAEYILVLSLFLVVSYIMAYFSALFVRLKRGIVTKRMLEYPKWKFGAIGLMDAFGLVMQLAAAVHLPGAIIPVLAQINIPFSLLVSRVLLGRRFQGRQLLGSGLVIGGVLLSLRPYAMDTILSGPSMVANAALYASSYIFAAISAVGKESILHNRDYGEDGMDVFVINSFGSFAQGAAIFLMLALASVIHGNLPGTGGHPLSYLREGFRCFQDNPSLPLAYIMCNIMFNLNVVQLVKKSSAVLTTLSITFVVPLTFVAFSFPIPTLQPVPFYPDALKGLSLLTAGILLYNISPDVIFGGGGKQKQEQPT